MNENNVKTIQTIYGAFGRGDVAAIQALVTDDTHWDFAVAGSDVPWHVPVKGKAAVPAFFGAFGGNVELSGFEPAKFMAAGDDVLVHVRIAYTVKKTGKKVAMDQIHWWTLAGGKVARLRHFEDTAQVLAANG